MHEIDRKRLRQKIYICGYTNQQLANEIGVSPSTISNILLGHTKPKFEVLRALFGALELSFDEFVQIFFPHEYQLNIDKDSLGDFDQGQPSL